MEANGAMNYITYGRKKRQHTTEAGNGATKAFRMKFPTLIFFRKLLARKKVLARQVT